ncbi:MAG TPA: MBL fold metallo-hydrolase [Candidatus Binatia bacterium]|jgi:glyoxylase-like metal-dependent hydrolase (beta-lactamase superfamily II)
MQTWRIGSVTVTKIVELEATGGTRFILPHATPEVCRSLAWMKPHFMDDDGRLKMSVHALLVETPSRRIIVDTCLGNDKQGRSVPGWNNLQSPFLQDLAAAGFPRDSIDTVICTHLHVDHVGWNTTLKNGRWVPTFPNARHLMGRTEFEYWRDQEEFREQVTVFADSVQPIVEAGLTELVAPGHQVCDEVTLEPTLGHTPGHLSVRISSHGEEALITGDFLHHPCQMARPEWAAVVDYDAERSTRTRRDVFAALAGTGTLLIGTHFAGVSAGRVVRDGDAYKLAV